MGFFAIIFFSFAAALIMITNTLTIIFFSYPLMILTKCIHSNCIQDIGQYIQDLIINKILFNGGEKSLASIILVICTICALLFTAIHGLKLKPSKVFKNLIIVVCLSITIGTFMQNTVAFHKTLEKAIQQPLDSLINCHKIDTEIQQKSLIFKIFQEQPFLLRHFGVSKIEDIKTLGNFPGDHAAERAEIESADTQYERLLLGYPEGKEKFGTENYAIHQALEPKDNIFQDKATKNGCANTYLKTRERPDVETKIFLNFLISTFLIIPTFIIMLILLLMLLTVVFLSFLRPITTIFSCFKCILETNFKMLFNVLINTITWILFLPVAKTILQYIILAFMNTVSYSQTLDPIIPFFLCLMALFLLVHIIKNIKTYWQYLKNLIKGVSKFSLDAINPNSNAFNSINNKLLQPVIANVQDKTHDFLNSNILNNIPKQDSINGDEDIIGEVFYDEITIGSSKSIKGKYNKNNESISKDTIEKKDTKENSQDTDEFNNKTDIDTENVEIIRKDEDTGKNGPCVNKQKDIKKENIIDEQNILEIDDSKEVEPSIKKNIDKPKDEKEEIENNDQKDLSDLIEKDNPNNKKINDIQLQNNNENISIIRSTNKPIISNEEKEKIRMDIFNCEELPTQNKDVEFVMSKKMIYAQRRLSRRIYRKKIISKKDKKK